jgi:hypothetical protein
MTEEELKALCKELFIITQNIYGICFLQETNKRIMLDKIEELASKAYNMHADAVKKGLWNDGSN